MAASSLIGKRFGKLIVTQEWRDEKSRIQCLCQCDCGNTKTIRRDSLKNGRTSSCGCYAKERHPKKHGLSRSRIYGIWLNMKNRCLKPNAKHYEYYGGRGITVTDEWLGENGFDCFYKWAMENGYSDGLTIDRIDTNFGYAPDNCRWATMAQQVDNRSNTRYMTLNGETKSIKEWSKTTGLSRRVLYYRTTHGWNDEKALTTPIMKQFRRAI